MCYDRRFSICQLLFAQIIYERTWAGVYIWCTQYDCFFTHSYWHYNYRHYGTRHHDAVRLTNTSSSSFIHWQPPTVTATSRWLLVLLGFCCSDIRQFQFRLTLQIASHSGTNRNNNTLKVFGSGDGNASRFVRAISCLKQTSKSINRRVAVRNSRVKPTMHERKSNTEIFSGISWKDMTPRFYYNKYK